MCKQTLTKYEDILLDIFSNVKGNVNSIDVGRMCGLPEDRCIEIAEAIDNIRFKSTQYYVDERVGCVAVRDARVKSETHGLHSDTPGVVAFWKGQYIPNKSTSFTNEWTISDEQISQARKKCIELNADRN